MGLNSLQVGIPVHLDTDVSVSGVITKIHGHTVWVNNKVSTFSLYRWKAF